MPQETNIGERSLFLEEERQVSRSLKTYLSEQIHTDVGSREQQQALNEPIVVVMNKGKKDSWIPVGLVAPPMPTGYTLVSTDAFRRWLWFTRGSEPVGLVAPPMPTGYTPVSTDAFRRWLSITRGSGDDLITEVSEDPAPPVETTTLTGRATGPVQFFENLVESWGLDEEASAKLLGFEGTIELSDLLSGTVSLRGRDTKDRLRHLLEIGFALDSLFRNENSVRMWLREPLGELGDESPLDHLREGSMEHLLRLRQLVEFLSGR